MGAKLLSLEDVHFFRVLNHSVLPDRAILKNKHCPIGQYRMTGQQKWQTKWEEGLQENVRLYSNIPSGGFPMMAIC